MSEQLRLSASQISLFIRCKRAWYYRYVEKIKVTQKPWLQYGSDFHEYIEKKYKNILEENVLYDSEIIRMVNDAFDRGILYTPKTFLIEKEIKIPINDNTHMTGKVDMIDVTNGKIIDHKTIKSSKYALTVNELREDLQLNIYGYWYLLKLPKKKSIQYRHNQLHKGSSDLTTFKEVTVARELVEKYWNFVVMPIVEDIISFSQHKTKEHFPCNLKSCSDYGGCDYKYICEKRSM